MAYPNGTIVADLVTKTPLGRRRNRFYYVSDGAAPDTASKLTLVANALMDHLGEPLAAVMDSRAKVERCEVRYYSGEDGEWESTSNVASLVGGIDAEIIDPASPEHLLPDEVSLIIRIHTGMIGRAKRGRRFITGLSEEVNNEGEVNPDWKSQCIDIATAVPQDVAVSGDVEPGPEGFATTLHARHYDRKDNILLPIVKSWAISSLGTRMDRRRPLRLDVLTI